MRQHFFVGEEYLGCRGIPHHWRPILSEPPKIVSSYHYFCQYCGTVWGRLMHEHPQALNQVNHRPCLRHAHHGWGGNLASIPSWGDEIPTAFAADWPDGAVRWEFKVMIHHYEKEANHAN